MLAIATLAIAAPRAAAAPALTPESLALAGGEREPAPTPQRRLALAVVESVGLMLPATIYYWSTTNLQKEDWELDWDWESWRTKLTSLDALIVDTGTWESNAMRHPIVGALSYQVGRANGYGPGVSTVFDFLSAMAWEYLVEFKERVSINDLVVNTASGFLIGEPLFQLGRVADDPGASWTRRGVAAIASPFYRLHDELGYRATAPVARAWSRLELGLGAGVTRDGGSTRPESRVAVDIDLVRHRHYHAPGAGASWTSPGAWSRIDAEVRASDDGVTGVRASSMTTYAGRFWRDHDEDGRGADRFLGLAAGFDYDSRRLENEWDRTAVFHLIGPRLALGYRGAHHEVRWELAAYGDVAMVQAHAFGPVPPFSFDLTSVLRARGYYYATGASAITRIGVLTPRWTGELEARAYQMWSIDGLDRVEMNGGPNDLDDPELVADERVRVRARGGIFLGASSDLRLELGAEASFRRGTWSAIDRRTTSLGIDADLTFGF